MYIYAYTYIYISCMCVHTYMYTYVYILLIYTYSKVPRFRCVFCFHLDGFSSPRRAQVLHVELSCRHPAPSRCTQPSLGGSLALACGPKMPFWAPETVRAPSFSVFRLEPAPCELFFDGRLGLARLPSFFGMSVRIIFRLLLRVFNEIIESF